MTAYPSKDIDRAAAHGAGAKDARPRALVVAVTPESPADDAGFEPGCFITAVDNQPLRDIIDWRWQAADDVIVLDYVDLDGEAGEVELEREPGEDWGFAFEGVVFDGVKQCRNACTFCFMRQLPEHMRPALTLRDDDFRLSFLSGTFVTFTNLTSDDEARIVRQRISPLRMSLHAADAQTRRKMIGCHAQHGIDALERLLAAGINVHAQIVLVPGQNDGAVLENTLNWAYERPGIINIGIVPLGYTKHQQVFDHSYNAGGAARGVLDVVGPYQRRALSERGTSWVFAADEFYRNAYGPRLLDYLPPAFSYGDFELFEDGIGIVRSHVDDWIAAEASGLVAQAAAVLAQSDVRLRFIAGEAMRDHFTSLVARSALAGILEPLYVKNVFFGGNVDVTGLLCGCDIVKAVKEAYDGAQGVEESRVTFVIPRVVFNDDAVTLDDMSLEDMEKATGAPLAVVSCTTSDFLREIVTLVGR